MWVIIKCIIISVININGNIMLVEPSTSQSMILSPEVATIRQEMTINQQSIIMVEYIWFCGDKFL